MKAVLVRRIGLLLRVVSVATVLFAMALHGAVPRVLAEPPASDEPVAENAFTVPWKALGLPGELGFLATGTPQDVAIPVPDGTRAQRLQGRIDLPIDSTPGYLEIDDDQGNFVAAVDLPAAGAGRVTFPFDVDISSARQADSRVALTARLRQVDDELRCRPREQVTVTDLVTLFTGAEPLPATVAAFFPSVLERVNVYVPADADQSEQQAVLALSSELARSYAPQPLRVTVAKQPRGASPPPAGPRARAVVVERGSAALDVVDGGTPGVHLKVTGRGDELSRQVSLLDNQLQMLAQVPSVRVDQAGSSTPSPDPESGSETTTFRQLNMDGNADVLGAGSFTVGVDRAALGTGRIDGARIHLLADYTPVGADDSATLAVVVNGNAVHTQALDGSGRVDTTFDLPSEALRQRVNLDFEMTYTPHLPCSTLTAPLHFWVDPESTVTVKSGGSPTGEFSSLPSEFSPDFLVAFDGSGPDQLGYASDVVVELARMTTAKLSPRVVELASALDSETSALIVARSSSLQQSSLQLPIGGNDSAIDVDLPTQLRVDVDRGIGSIQTIADRAGDRTVVLVTTTAAWGLVPPVLDYLTALPGGWAGLTGNVLAAGAQGTPVNLSIPVASPAPEPEPSRGWLVWVGVGVAAAVVAAVLGAWLLRRRRPARD